VNHENKTKIYAIGNLIIPDTELSDEYGPGAIS
jgi:hypothetical protein